MATSQHANKDAVDGVFDSPLPSTSGRADVTSGNTAAQERNQSTARQSLEGEEVARVVRGQQLTVRQLKELKEARGIFSSFKRLCPLLLFLSYFIQKNAVLSFISMRCYGPADGQTCLRVSAKNQIYKNPLPAI